MILTHIASPIEPRRPVARIIPDDNGTTYSAVVGPVTIASRLDYWAARDLLKRRGYAVDPTIPGRKES